MNGRTKIALAGVVVVAVAVSCTTRGPDATNDARPAVTQVAPKPARTVTVTPKAVPTVTVTQKPGPTPQKSESPLVCASCHAHQPLVLGSQGVRVEYLQGNLQLLGYDVVIDGDFGPQTEKAVRAFQADHGLVVDGVYGPQSEDAMAEVLAANH